MIGLSVLFDLEQLIAVGGHHAHTELYSIQSDQWIQGPDYPFENRIQMSPILNFNNTFIMFAKGAIIAAFDIETHEWSQIGSTLNKSRYYFNAIELPNQEFLVFGGAGSYSTEKCSWQGDLLECEAQEPTVKDYLSWPEMFYVTDNYCEYDELL